MGLNLPLPMDKVNKPGHINLKEDLDAVMSETLAGVEDLEERITRLPPVDSKGRSEDPDAETRYAQMEEGVIDLKTRLALLRPCVAALSEDIVARHARLDIVVRGRERLRGNGLVPEYDLAAGGLWTEIRRLEARRAAVQEVVKKGEEALTRADRKNWPLGKPKQRPRGLDDPAVSGESGAERR